MKCRVLRIIVALLLTAYLPAASVAWHAQDKPTNKATGDDKKSIDQNSKRGVAQKDNPVILNSDLVSVTVTVTDTYGRYVTGLTKDNFEVYDDKVKQPIAHFSDADAPVSLGIVYDVSGSMKE
ncbi:MAG: hypothetical protein ACREAC_07785, partial [Blastocatellia bacterium]